MTSNQRTIKKEVRLNGTGLHSGSPASILLIPRQENFGIQFQRVDVPWKPIIEAKVANVTDTSRGTTLSDGTTSIQTVEHLLAAIAGLGIDNLLIVVDGPEIPILDGSSALFVESLLEGGIKEQSEPKKYIIIPERLSFSSEDGISEYEVSPYPGFMLEVQIDYGSGVLGSQQAVLNELSAFGEEIASARTFCFLHELEHLHRAGKIRGGDLANAIVISERTIERGELDELAALLGRPSIPAQKAGILNHTPLRYTNEPARHKLLDLVGDLFLSGGPIQGKISVSKPGHTANVALVKMIKDRINQLADHRV